MTLYVALVYFLVVLVILFLKPMFGWPLVLVLFLYAWGSQYLGYEVRK